MDLRYLDNQFEFLVKYTNRKKSFYKLMTNYSEQFGALQFCLRFGLIPAQKLKAKQLPDKISLYKIIFPEEYWVLDSIKSIFELEGLAIIP